MEKRPSKLKKILAFTMIISICFLSIVYAQISYNLNIKGTLGARATRGIVITGINYNGNDSEQNTYYGSILNSVVVLPEKKSIVTYTITVYNGYDKTMYFDDIIYESGIEFYSNNDIEFLTENLKKGDKLESKKSCTFNLKFKYKDAVTSITNNTLKSTLKVSFIDTVSDIDIDFDVSNIPSGQKFMIGETKFDASKKTFFADIDVSSLVAGSVNENLISIGTDIDNFFPSQGEVLHVYYPDNNGNAIIAPILKTGGQMQFRFTLPDASLGRLKLAFNTNGLYVNGIKIFDATSLGSKTTSFNKIYGGSVEDYLNAFFSNWNNEIDIKIGSKEGNGRSTAKYNKVSIYANRLSNDEMIKLTTVEDTQIRTDITYNELDKSVIIPNQKFLIGNYDFEALNQTFYIEMDVNDILSNKNENIISLGSNIDLWTPSNSADLNMHFYYPNNNNQMIIATIMNGNTKQFGKTISSDSNRNFKDCI